MIDTRLENFLLYILADDWIPLGEFMFYARRITPEDASVEKVAAVIREMATSGLITLGSWGPSGAVEPWNVSVDEAMARIADGYQGEIGYRGASKPQLQRTEVFRADLTAKGSARLRELGDPYDNYGDPWADVPHLRVSRPLPDWEV